MDSKEFDTERHELRTRIIERERIIAQAIKFVEGAFMGIPAVQKELLAILHGEKVDHP